MTNNQIKRINHVAPFFSLVMPVYNGQKFLQQAMESVLQQTFLDFELLVVDDGSTDETATIVNRFAKQDARIRYFKQPKNRGVSAARNTGLTNARGQFVGFCDADDCLELETLQTVYTSLQRQPAVLVVFGFYEDYYDEAWQLTTRETKVATAGLFTVEAEIIPEILCLLRDNLYQYTWNKFYKLAWLREQQVQFEDIPFCEDVVFNLKLCRTLAPMLVVPAALYHYRHSEQASLTTHYTENFLPAHFHLLGQEYDCLKKQNYLIQALPILSELCVRYAFVGLQMAFHAQASRDAFALHYQQLQAFTYFKELVTYGKGSLPGLRGILAWALASDNKMLIKVVSWCIFIVKHRFVKLWCWLK